MKFKHHHNCHDGHARDIRHTIHTYSEKRREEKRGEGQTGKRASGRAWPDKGPMGSTRQDFEKRVRWAGEDVNHGGTSVADLTCARLWACFRSSTPNVYICAAKFEHYGGDKGHHCSISGCVTRTATGHPTILLPTYFEPTGSLTGSTFSFSFFSLK